MRVEKNGAGLGSGGSRFGEIPDGLTAAGDAAVSGEHPGDMLPEIEGLPDGGRPGRQLPETAAACRRRGKQVR